MSNCSGCDQCNDGVLSNAKQADESLDSLEPLPLAQTFQEQFEARFPSLSFEFIELMAEIGKYGFNKYGEASLEAKMKRGDYSRNDRTLRREIAKHSATHFQEYIDGITHDKFGTVEHQLAAASFNPMMEFLLSGGKR